MFSLRLIIITTVVCLVSPFVINNGINSPLGPLGRGISSFRQLEPRPISPQVKAQISRSHNNDKELADEIEPTCLYKTPSGWKQRIQLTELEIGQTILGERISGTDLLDGKTGPKLFFECGIGRIDANGRWQMVSAMLRFQTKYKKLSVIRKKAAKFSGNQVELYVHKIRLDNGKLEVCADQESFLSAIANDKNKSIVPTSSLQIGQELTGTVIELRPYGCIIDVGANRNGLLHIQKVADLYGTYIDKEKGLEKAGLELGAVIRVSVIKNERKKLALDFTQDVKEEREIERSSEVLTNFDDDKSEEGTVPSKDEFGAWGDYTADDYGEEDEDRDIEDALGLGSY